ncbi:MAG: hypothetical protein Q9227_003748 [Pyrenula ochraceoflavens]
MWVDGSAVDGNPTNRKSRLKRLSAAAVRYLDPSSRVWKEFVTLNTLPCGSKFALKAEFIAIPEAFRFATRLTASFDRLLIMSDCQQLLRDIKAQTKLTSRREMEWVNNFFMYTNLLHDLGINVELRWVPAHSSVEGNEPADKLAKQVRRSARWILAQELPDLIVNSITVTGSSLESICQALFPNTAEVIQYEETHDHRIVRKEELHLDDRKHTVESTSPGHSRQNANGSICEPKMAFQYYTNGNGWDPACIEEEAGLKRASGQETAVIV